jgi:hypothetical protein
MRWTPWVLALPLCLFHLTVVVGYTGLLKYAGGDVSLEAVLYWLLVLGSGLYLVFGMAKPAFRKSRKFVICNLVVLACLSVVAVWLLTDDKPLTDDYTAADIRTKDNGSYQYFKVFNNRNAEELERIIATLKDQGQAEAAWNQITKYRRTVDVLDSFDTICDLPPDAPLDMSMMPFLSFRALTDTADIYNRYFLHKVAQGQAVQAVDDVSHFYGFTRKTLSKATVLIDKMVFLAMADKSIHMAYEAISDNRCDRQTMEILRQIYTPLQPEEFGLSQAIIGEYLFMTTTIQKQVKPDTLLDFVAMSSTHGSSERLTAPMSSRFAYYVAFKPNMSRRDIKQNFDLLIEAQKSAPPDYSAVMAHAENYRRHPRLRNMAGWILNCIAMPDFARYSSKAVNIKVRSDLLAIALHKKAGRPLEIKDYFTNGPYRYREEHSAMRHPGQDGRYNTGDDIVLGTLAQN